MKICILTLGHSPFDSRIFYKEVLSLVKVYKDITLAVCWGEDRAVKKEDVQGVNVVQMEGGTGFLGRMSRLWRLYSFGKRERADMYHVHDFELLAIGLGLKVFGKCSLIYDAHEHQPDRMRDSEKIPRGLHCLLAFLVDIVESALSRFADFIIAADKVLWKRYRKFNRNVVQVGNLPRLELFRENGNALSDLKSKYEGYEVVIYVGAIHRPRGAVKLVEAIREVKREIENIKLLFVGPLRDAECKREMERLIKENELDDNVELAGVVDHTEVADYIRVSKVGMATLLPIPKFFKNVPTKQFEYAACGIPIVGSKLPPIEEFVSKEGCGVVVNPTEPKEIAAAICHLLEDRKEAKRMGDRGRKAVEKRYNWGRMEGRLLDVYSKLERR